MKINKGRINADNNYEKIVKFSKAVLWKDKQLSIPRDILDNLIRNNVEKMIYIDRGKKEQWTFKVYDVEISGRLKQVGQEAQWYFPIELAIKKPICN